MNWAENKHPAEWIVELAAPALLAGAAGWSAWRTGLPLAAIVAATIIGLALAVSAMRMAEGKPIAELDAFEPVGIEEYPLTDELLLDDPLVETQAGSRVVRLFEREAPTPGEMVTRISDFLAGEAVPANPPEAQNEVPLPDASAALHAALANIRASLR